MEPLTPTDRRRAELTARETAILDRLTAIIAEFERVQTDLDDKIGQVRVSALAEQSKNLRHLDTVARRELSETRAALAALPSPLSAEPADEAAVKARAGRVLSAAINGELPITEAERVRAAQQAWVASADAWQTEAEQYGAPPDGRDFRRGPLR